MKKQNIKFWIKIILAILPIIGIIVFFSGQTNDLMSDKIGFWNYVLNGREDEFDPHFYEWTDGQNIGYLISRNIFMLTTLGNIMASVFFINSAINNKKEGSGKFDNYRYGLMVVNTLLFIVIFYNASLIFTNAISIMKWYNYVSWLLEHSIPQILMCVYLIGFYNKKNKNFQKQKTNIKSRKMWLINMLIAIAPVMLYHVFFVILGYILKATDAFPIFGDMSTTGYFPYNYMDFTSSNRNIMMSWLKPWSQFLGIIIIISLEQVGMYSLLMWSAKRQVIKIK